MSNWCIRIQEDLSLRHTYSLDHIYREFNTQADKLSKLALDGDEGLLFWEDVCEDVVVDAGSLYFLV